MPWKAIVAGVDASPEGAAAAGTAWNLARKTGAECHLVHVTNDVSAMPATLPPTVDLDELMTQVTSAARREVEHALRNDLPGQALGRLEIRMGRAGWVLPQVVREREADLLVLGGKHHRAPTRWFGGSTAHHAVRTLDVPTLVVVPAKPVVNRILAAVDLSYAAKPVLRFAQEMAALYEAEIRVVHVVEPLPYSAEVPVIIDHAAYVQWSGRRFEEIVAEALPERKVEEVVVRHGASSETVGKEAAAWKADLLITGSHGKGWVDRVLVGSTTQRLLNRLPTSLLIVPVGPPPTDERASVD